MYSKPFPKTKDTISPAVMPKLPNKDIKITFTAEALADPKITPCLNSGKSLRDCMVDQIAQHVGENYRAELESVIEQVGDNILIYRVDNAKSPIVRFAMLSLTAEPLPADMGTLELIERGSGSSKPSGKTKAASHFSEYKGLYIGAGVLATALVIMAVARKK